MNKKDTIILQNKKLRTFILNCIKYFYEKKDLWPNINNFVQTKQVNLNTSIKIGKDNCFSLVGMFIYSTDDEIKNRNNATGTKRWFENKFVINDWNCYLSTQWNAKPNKNNGKPYSLMFSDFASFISICFGEEFQCSSEDDSFVLRKKIGNYSEPVTNNFVVSEGNNSNSFSIKKIIKLIQETGLIYSDNLIKRFAFSLMAKRFVILSGLAGSGKTQLALSFASALVEDKSKQMCVVSVGADWTNREPLLGFPNALQAGTYVRPESGVLDLLIEANNEENNNKPFFLILDEMNMSYVERYFADFLSAMESHEEIALWKPQKKSEDLTPASIVLPNNLFIIGTINVDETTYMFSPKVLDRANVIEFKISDKEMEDYLLKYKVVNRDIINSKASKMGASLVNLSNIKELNKTDEVINIMKDFFKELKSVNAEFGYRTATEIFRFIKQSQENDDTDNKMDIKQIVDAAIVQKLLPKLHGSRKKLEPVLKRLWKLCFEYSERDLMNLSSENIHKAIYIESADKIYRMYKSALDNGFTSFAEA